MTEICRWPESMPSSGLDPEGRAQAYVEGHPMGEPTAENVQTDEATEITGDTDADSN